MENRLNKFRGKIEFIVKDTIIVLNSFSVSNLFDLVLLSKKEKPTLKDNVDLFVKFISQDYTNEPIEEIEQFVLQNFSEILNSFLLSIGWIKEEELEERKNLKNDSNSKKASLALFKARLAAEVDNGTIEDKYITSCYYIMKDFGYDIFTMLNMPATTFIELQKEIKDDVERQKKEQDNARRKRFR